MVSQRNERIQITGQTVALIGWLMVIVACALPMWQVTGHVIDISEWTNVGLWMSCVMTTGQSQCRYYEHFGITRDAWDLPLHLQAARAMILISIATGLLAAVVAIAPGAKRNNCIEEKRSKARARALAGILFITSGLLCLIPVSWSTIAIITDTYSRGGETRELGAALYIGWVAAPLLLLGGSLLCWNCPLKDHHHHHVAEFTPVSSDAGLEMAECP